MESTCFNVGTSKRGSIMGPYSEDVQFKRAESIKRLLEQNPQIDPLYRGMWENKLRALAKNETEYNWRVRSLYEGMKRGPVIEY